MPDGELVCLRSFCVFCLKISHDSNIKEIRSRSDWVCPVCAGNCCCTRCVRNDLLVKLGFIFIEEGGDIRLLREETPIKSTLDSLPILPPPNIEKARKPSTRLRKSPPNYENFEKKALSHSKGRKKREKMTESLLKESKLTKKRSYLEKSVTKTERMRKKKRSKTKSTVENQPSLQELAHFSSNGQTLHRMFLHFEFNEHF